MPLPSLSPITEPIVFACFASARVRDSSLMIQMTLHHLLQIVGSLCRAQVGTVARDPLNLLGAQTTVLIGQHGFRCPHYGPKSIGPFSPAGLNLFSHKFAQS